REAAHRSARERSGDVARVRVESAGRRYRGLDLGARAKQRGDDGTSNAHGPAPQRIPMGASPALVMTGAASFDERNFNSSAAACGSFPFVVTAPPNDEPGWSSSGI